MQAEYLPSQQAPRALIYLIGMEAKDARAVQALLSTKATALAAVSCEDWNAQLSPWKAKRAFKGGDDFAGGAQEYLEALISAAIPKIEGELGFTPKKRGIVGYSLAGLFALYALTQTRMFSLVGSVSGSLWYDGFLEHLAASPITPDARVYLSLGDLESNARNPRLAAVGQATQAAKALLDKAGCHTVFEWNAGNHFVDSDKRIAKAIDWLVRDA